MGDVQVDIWMAVLWMLRPLPVVISVRGIFLGMVTSNQHLYLHQNSLFLGWCNLGSWCCFSSECYENCVDVISFSALCICFGCHICLAGACQVCTLAGCISVVSVRMEAVVWEGLCSCWVWGRGFDRVLWLFV